MIAQSDFEKLEAQLQGLESRIKNQQRDLHALPKIARHHSQSQAVVEPNKQQRHKKMVHGRCAMRVGIWRSLLLAGRQSRSPHSLSVNRFDGVTH